MRRNHPDVQCAASAQTSRRGEVPSRTQIASYVWDMNFDGDSNVVDVAIGRLRAKSTTTSR